ncbi:hypothetical protein Q8A73_007495 [Channa argus]|nr:hypothetical protein Q8A73_007495 [Channa argus]
MDCFLLKKPSDLCIFCNRQGHRPRLRGAVVLSVSSHAGKWSSQAFPLTVVQNNPMSSPNQESGVRGFSRPLHVDMTQGRDNGRIRWHAVWSHIPCFVMTTGCRGNGAVCRRQSRVWSKLAGNEEEAAVWTRWTAFSSRALQNLPGASLKQREEEEEEVGLPVGM